MPHVALIQRNHEIQTFSADRPDQAFAERVRLRRPHRRLDDRQFHRRDRPIDTPGVNAVVVVDDVSMRPIARHHHPELLDRPFRRRMVGHVPVQDPARAPSDGGMRR